MFILKNLSVQQGRPRQNVRHLTRQTGVSTSTARNICREDLLFPHKMKLGQPLWKDERARCCAFAWEKRALLENIPAILNIIWFSDEVHFHLGGHINKQNVRFWASGNLRFIVANPVPPKNVVPAWNIEISSTGISGPVSIDGTVTSDIYFSLLCGEFIPFLMWYSIPMNSNLFQQDGSTDIVLSCDIWGRIFMASNFTELQPFRLFSIWIFERFGISEKYARNSRTEKCRPIRDWSHLCKTSNQRSEQTCPSFA
jgi:hypothetical protein